MAGIYVHIPFCRRACTYCDFHFSTNLSQVSRLAQAIGREAEMARDFFPNPSPLSTLYFGGGTPSLLAPADLEQLLDAIHTHFSFAEGFEFTFECNPDDLSPERLQRLKSAGVNRLSIGVQSFRERDLQLMGRSHNATQARQSITDAQEAGFSNLTVDLIYGIPDLSAADWAENVQTLIALGVPHVSAYALTVEPQTALAHQVRQKTVVLPPDEAFEQQYFYLIDALRAAGIVHYELSNFARPGHHSRHNSAYWEGEAYLGLGPSAHSFKPHTRSWNMAHNARYLQRVEAGERPTEEVEELGATDRLNEYLLTQLRRVPGIQRSDFREKFGQDLWEMEAETLEKYAQQELLEIGDQQLRLTRQGLLLSNTIIADLFQ